MATPSQQTESTPPPSGEKQVSLEREVASLMETMSHPAVLTGLILFGLLLDFIGQLVRVGATSSAGFSAFQVLTAIGTFLIVAVLFISGLVRRGESDMIRFSLILSAAIILFAIPSLMA